MDESLIKGDVTELQCVLDFQKRGYYVSIPFSGSCRYDVVVDINGKLLRIQCKSCTYNNGAITFSTIHQTINTKEIKKYKYTSDEIDFFYTAWNKYSFLIPVNEVSLSKVLRVEIPKSGIQSQMNVAHDYLIDNVINSIANNTPILRYIDNSIVSIDSEMIEKLWNTKEILDKWGKKGLRYIRECAAKGKNGYNYTWKFKDFPTLK